MTRIGAAAGTLADHGLLFELQIFASQMADRRAARGIVPSTSFVLEHVRHARGHVASAGGFGGTAWRRSPLSECQRQTPGLGTFVHACRDDVAGPIVKETVALFGADRCFYGSNFPIEKLWTGYGELYPAPFAMGHCASRRDRAGRNPARHRGAALSALGKLDDHLSRVRSATAWS